MCVSVCAVLSFPKGGARRDSPLTADDAIGFIYLIIFFLFIYLLLLVWRRFASFNHVI